MDIQNGPFAAPRANLVDGLASTKSEFPVSASTDAILSSASNLSSQASALLLGLLLLLIGCLA